MSLFLVKLDKKHFLNWITNNFCQCYLPTLPMCSMRWTDWRNQAVLYYPSLSDASKHSSIYPSEGDFEARLKTRAAPNTQAQTLFSTSGKEESLPSPLKRSSGYLLDYTVLRQQECCPRCCKTKHLLRVLPMRKKKKRILPMKHFNCSGATGHLCLKVVLVWF